MNKHPYHHSDHPFNRKSRDMRFFIVTVLGIAALLGCYVIFQAGHITLMQWVVLSAISLGLYLWYVLRLAFRTR